MTKKIVKALLLPAICFCMSGAAIAQDEFMIDTGLAVESAKPAPTAIPQPTAAAPAATAAATAEPTAQPTAEASAEATAEITAEPSPGQQATPVPQEESMIDRESDDTEGIIILSPGEVDPEALEKFVQPKEAPEKKRKEIEYEDETEFNVEYNNEDKGEILLLEAEDSGKIEKAGYVLIERAGFVSDNFKEDGTLFSQDANREILSQGDEVYIKITVGKGITKKSSFMVYDDSEELYNPMTDEYMGRIIKVGGTAKIIKKVKEGVYKAKITRSYGIIKNNFKVKMRNEMKEYHSKLTRKIKKKKVNAEGHIVKLTEYEYGANNKDIVYIDKGLNSGVLPGVKFDIIRKTEDPDTGEEEEYHEIGRVMIINSMKDSAVAMIVSQNEVIQVGDKVKAAE